MHQSVKKAVTVGIILLTVVVVLLGCGRNWIVRHYVDLKLDKIEQQRNLTIHYKDLYMDGISGIYIDSLSIVPVGADTFLHAGSLNIQLTLSGLLRLKPEIKSIGTDGLSVSFIKKENTSNFDFLYQGGKSSEACSAEPDETERNYAGKTRKTLDMLFKLLPTNATLSNLSVSYSNKGDELLIEVPSLIISDNQFVTNIHSQENGIRSEWVLEGALQDNERSIEARLHSTEHTKISLPFLEYRWGAQVRFDTLSFKLEETVGKADLQSIRGHAQVSGLTVHQERISPDTVLLDQGTFAWQINIGKNYLELDSSTEVRFNQLDFHPYLKVTKEKDWRITASVNKNDFPANDLFSSLPHGLFYNLEGLEASGNLSYHFLLDVDFSEIDSLLFESTLSSRNFAIQKYGNTDLRKMNEPFLYTAYEQGEAVRTFEIGESNLSYRPFHAVSRYLPLSIMQSEDAGFFVHNGFIPSAIRESLILDLKEKRFARGGSTLSMQLVKNVFLSRNKTIARKLEEILIVWLIESNRLTPKERMFEVYLNIVEWGPMIYGVADASHFYFRKDPSALTLSECIFLASIIPKPKHVRSCFDGLQLKPYYSEFYKVITNRLVDRGLILPEEAIDINPEAVKITGPAKAYLTGPANMDYDQSEDTII